MRLKQKWLAKSQDISAQLNQGESFLALPLILYDGLTGCMVQASRLPGGGNVLKTKKKSMRKRLKALSPYLWLLPSAVLLLVMVFIPIVRTIWLSLNDISRACVAKGWNNFANYISTLQTQAFWRVMLNTVIWTVGCVGISTLLGFILALILNEKFHGRKIARTILIFPWATSLAITAGMWKYIYDANYGGLNALLNALGFQSVNWLNNSYPWQMFALMIVVAIVVTVPFVTFCLLSGMQGISHDYYEAASIDGAGPWKRMIHITIPHLRPAFNTSTVLNVIYVFNSFPIVWTISMGAPAHMTDTITTYMYAMSFKAFDYGTGTSVSVIGFLFLLIFSLVYMGMTMKKEEM